MEEIRESKLSKIDNDIKKLEVEMTNELKNKSDKLAKSISENICKTISGLLENILKELSNEELEDIIISKFILEIKNLSEEDLENIKNRCKSRDNSKVIVYSPFLIKDDYKKSILEFLENSNISFDNIEYIEDKDLILGIKIDINGYIINSNIQNVIEKFNNKLKESF